MRREAYKSVIIEAVYPDGSVAVRNAFKMENDSCMAGDPDWPREKLVGYAQKVMYQWIETYWWHPATLRLVK